MGCPGGRNHCNSVVPPTAQHEEGTPGVAGRHRIGIPATADETPKTATARQLVLHTGEVGPACQTGSHFRPACPQLSKQGGSHGQDGPPAGLSGLCQLRSLPPPGNPRLPGQWQPARPPARWPAHPSPTPLALLPRPPRLPAPSAAHVSLASASGLVWSGPPRRPVCGVRSGPGLPGR